MTVVQYVEPKLRVIGELLSVITGGTGAKTVHIVLEALRPSGGAYEVDE